MAAPEQEKSATARTEARREALLDATVRAIGLHGASVSMETIAGEAGITKPILYRHFGDKRGLASALTQRYLRELSAELSSVRADDLRELTRALLDGGIRYLEERPHLLEFINQERGFAISESRPGEHAEPLMQLIARAMRARELDPQAAALIATGLGALINAMVNGWLRDPAVPRERFIELVVAMIWDGLSAQLGDANPAADPPVRWPARGEG
jgi:AcrR family transcriptional regulator